MTLRVLPLGGLGEVGMNSMLFDSGETAFLLDAGLMFPDDTMLGIDYVVPDFSLLHEAAPHLCALLLTHGHEDHIGGVPFLLKEFDVPVYGTPLTLGLLRHRLSEHGLERARLMPIARKARFRVGDFDIEAFPVCHSIPDAVGYILRCGEGTFVHTGDFKIDASPLDGVPTGIERLKEVSEKEGVIALFSDSTNIEQDGHSLPEKFVGEALSEVFAEARGRVIVAMFSSNLHRVREALKAAARCGRRVALSGKSMIRNVETAIDLGYLVLPQPNILAPIEDAALLPDRRVVVVTTGTQGESRSALSLMALGEHKYIKVRPGDTVVLSSKFIPGNERAIAGMINRLFLAGADVLYEKISEIHVSGHGSREELEEMIEAVRPENFIPVHGEPRLLVRHRNLARKLGVPGTEMALNGDVLLFKDGMVERADRMEVGRFFVDGKGVGDVEGVVLKDRYNLSQVGLVMVALVLSPATGEVLYGPDIIARGVLMENGEEELLDGAKSEVLKVLDELHAEARTDFDEMRADIRRVLRRYFNKRLERKPMIVPVLMEL
ncbi:MAG: ribonuclease J [Syntrophorhabdaceae bacterium]|nr:ribonuclease J [Syntrophorhabdaceae bacterium]